MSLGRNLMIGLGDAPLLGRMVRKSAPVRALRDRHVAGRDAAMAVGRAVELAERGMIATLWHLNANVGEAGAVGEGVAQIVGALEAQAEAGSGVCISVLFSPKQIGYGLSDDIGRRNMGTIAERFVRALMARREQDAKARKGEAGPGLPHRLLMMPDGYRDVARMLELHGHFHRAGVAVGATVQACLMRSYEDAMALISERAIIRLVAGVCAEAKVEAYREPAAIAENYATLAALLLSDEAHINTAYPIFVIDDAKQIDDIEPLLTRHEWEPGSYEFELVLGGDDALAKRLIMAGHRVSVRAPFGADWWPYVTARAEEKK